MKHKTKQEIEAFNKQIAQDTFQILEQGYYDIGEIRFYIAEDLKNSIKNSAHIKDWKFFLNYNEEFVKDIQKWPAVLQLDTKYEVTLESTLDACRRIYKKDANILALNFASATKPGGGVLNGRIAQEESLARSSSLYPTIVKHKKFYEKNKTIDTNHLYLDDIIYSPNVSIFKTDLGELTKPYYASFITSPAPNMGAILDNTPEFASKVEQVFLDRIEKILAFASYMNYKTLVLGAWGCGVFRNNPNDVAKWFSYHFKGKFKNVFQKVVFAIYDKEDGDIYKAFKKEFENER
jgi:uncharacterized protein (TIGR02452 family)